MLDIPLPKDLEERLDKLAGKTKRSKSYHVKKALQAYIEDREDYLLAAAALEEDEDEDNSYTWAEVKKRAKLDD